jgi:outer membrane protein OmpA-like peptidoglycan-associated protein
MCVIAGITGITTSAIGSIPKDYAALFEHGSATLTPAALVNVESAAAEAREALSHTDAIVIYVTGWADTSGSEEFNMRLSQRRAEAIARALMAAGIPKRNLEISWRGETELPVPTEDGVREQANRVVHFSIWGRPTAD